MIRYHSAKRPSVRGAWRQWKSEKDRELRFLGRCVQPLSVFLMVLMTEVTVAALSNGRFTGRLTGGFIGIIARGWYWHTATGVKAR
jgi:hypothetical protein